MIRIKQFIILLIIGVYFASCIDDINKEDKYSRPKWLAGKVYTQIKEQPELSMFARCIELTGYDTIINTSGSYTVFAPDNEAFALYFQNNPDYNSIEDIPVDELSRIVKYHIVQNPWSKDQLRTLDVFGWIDTLDVDNDEPKGYKRETLLLEKDLVFGVKKDKNKQIYITDTLKSNWHRRVSTDSRKFAPIFYKEYFNAYDLNSDDFEFYFDRPFGSTGDIYYVNGRITGDEIFAENGFVYNIDRVVETLQSAYQILNTQHNGQYYNRFLEMVNIFPEFTYNQDKTFNQPGAEQGFAVDSLFDLTYPELIFDITNEETTAPKGTIGLPPNVTIRYHHGMIIPTNEAFDEFVNEYLVGRNKWGSLEEAPRHIKRIITNTHMCDNAIYPTDLNKGFYNGEKDLVKLDQSTIVHQQYGSNCTFIGVNKAIAPRAFTSVAGPVYLLRGYSKVMYAVEQAGLLPALKRENKNYSFYVESDDNTWADSSLIYYPPTPTNMNPNRRFAVFLIAGISIKQYYLSTNDLRTLLMNHIGVDIPSGIPRKEFIKNLAGNYIIVNNLTGEVSGTAPTSDGYQGSIQTVNIPVQISTNADNGVTYDIGDWFSFSATSLFSKISASFPAFHGLLKKAGFSLDKEYRYSFISENEIYTVFVPTSEALNNYRADTLSIPDLKNFLLMHFVQGDIIFTDGKKPAAYYETARVDEKSTTYSTVFTQMFIDTGYDEIYFPDKSGNNYLTVSESASTNILTGRTLEEETGVFGNTVNNAVIHQINKVLLYKELDTR